MQMFKEFNINTIFKNKRVLVTGHTGFKGSWLSFWLRMLGARVIGVSNMVPTNPSHYNLIKEIFYKDIRLNIKDQSKIQKLIVNEKPDFIFHLAAQPIVIESYLNPIDTFQTNILGSSNILDALRISNHSCIAIMITSDKCYDNVEWPYGYRENDKLGGKDPYSASKGATEIVIRSYVESYFKNDNSNINIGIGRAGNVIGGGDWASNRIVPDCVKSWANNKKPLIRSPFSTRPWQHVLEPLSGYLTLAQELLINNKLNGEAFNFGPPSYQNHTVKELVDEITKHWPGSKWNNGYNDEVKLHEAGLLKLNCDKSLQFLSWSSTLNFKETAKWTSNWYKTFYNEDPGSASKMTEDQINNFMDLIKERNSFKLG